MKTESCIESKAAVSMSIEEMIEVLSLASPHGNRADHIISEDFSHAVAAKLRAAELLARQAQEECDRQIKRTGFCNMGLASSLNIYRDGFIFQFKGTETKQ